MGIYDRDYYRESPSRGFFGGFRLWSVNSWIIIINIAVFVINNLLTASSPDPSGYYQIVQHPIYQLGYFSVVKGVFDFQVWRFITFQFLHAGFKHILYNMIALFFFGPLIEGYLGSRRYAVFYLICGIAGPLMYIVMWMAHILITGPAVPMIGASAGIFGVLIAAALVAPDATVLVYFVLPVKLRTVAWVMLGIAAWSVLTNQLNSGGEVAHLGGAAAGWALIKNQQLLNFADFRRGPRMRIRR
jgi:membrane associated rhomboid family serine protease